LGTWGRIAPTRKVPMSNATDAESLHMSKSCWSKGPKVRMMNKKTGNFKTIEEEAKPNQGFSKGSE
jgi:hypothetical protein